MFFTVLGAINATRSAYHAGRAYTLEENLLNNMERECKDPRDKIFGLLALVDKGRYGELVPDYTLAWEDVFIRATQAMLRNDREGFSSICTSGFGLKPRSTKLPSWVRDFAKPINKENVDAERLRMAILRSVYHASSLTIARIAFPGPTQLQLTGVSLDTASSVGESTKIWSLPGNRSTLQEWMAMALSSELIPESDFVSDLDSTIIQWEPFWRTMLAGSMDTDTALTQVKQRAYETAQDLDRSRIFYPWLLGSGPEALDIIYYNQILIAITGRAFFITEGGHFGLCYPEVVTGDEVWVVYGSQVPFILRPCDDNRRGDSGARCYQYLGDCYVDGFMDGTAFDEAKHNEQEIILV
jgi:hypothetical protein